MTKQINKKILFSVLIVNFFVLIFAFIIEYGLNHQPCKLCLYERIPYFLSVLLIAKLFLTKGLEKITLLILSIVFIVSFVLAFYHLGIEEGFFKESFVCSDNTLSKALTKEEVLKQLKQNTISCKEVNFTIFGFSLAAINTIFSIALSVIFARLFINYGKN